MPTIEEIEIGPTRYHPYAPVFQNEGTNEGNVEIQKNYEEVQCRLEPEDPRWSSILVIYFGDLKTVQRILSVQEMRILTALSAYDRKQWMIPGLGLWHLRLNLLKLIHKIHWGGSAPQDSSTLQYAADAWGRTNVREPTDFNKLEELLIHSHHARVLAILHQVARKSFYRKGDAGDWLRTQNTRNISELINRIVERTNPSGFDADDQEPPLNENWHNHQCFIRHMDVYFMLCHAIKFADIGLLRQSLREVCIVFQAKEGHTFNYGPELLRLMHLYDSDAAEPELQRAMLANSLVNLQGKYGKAFEIDRLVEFLNGFVAVVRRDRTNSTRPVSELIRSAVLSAPYMMEVKRTLEKRFGKSRSGEHPPKDASEDIWTLAQDLLQGDLHTINEERFSAWPAPNLIRSGYQSLGENVYRYNEKIQCKLPEDEGTINEGDLVPITAGIFETVDGNVEALSM